MGTAHAFPRGPSAWRARRGARTRYLSWAALGAACVALAGCSFGNAARRSGERLRDGWDVDEKGYSVVWTGPASAVMAAGDLAYHSVVPPKEPDLEPDQKWFRFYDGPMRPLDAVAILCHVDRTTHVATIRHIDAPYASEARHQPWHYPRCIEVLPGSYELTVSYYSRRTVEAGLSATTTTSESTVPSTTLWLAEPGVVYVVKALLGKPSPAPGGGPTYRVRPRTKQLWETDFKLEVSHWKAAIVKLASSQQMGVPLESHRERWRHYESDR